MKTLEIKKIKLELEPKLEIKKVKSEPKLKIKKIKSEPNLKPILKSNLKSNLEINLESKPKPKPKLEIKLEIDLEQEPKSDIIQLVTIKYYKLKKNMIIYMTIYTFVIFILLIYYLL